MPKASEARAMTVREVASYLNVNEKTVYRLAQRRELPGFKSRRRVEVPAGGHRRLDREAEEDPER